MNFGLATRRGFGAGRASLTTTVPPPSAAAAGVHGRTLSTLGRGGRRGAGHPLNECRIGRRSRIGLNRFVLGAGCGLTSRKHSGGRLVTYRFGVVLLRLEPRGTDRIRPFGPTGGRFALSGEPDPIQHPLHELNEELPGRVVGDHRNARIGFETVPHLGPTLDGRERALPAQRPEGPAHLLELHRMRGTEGNAEDRLYRQADEVPPKGEDMRVAALLHRLRRHPQRRPVPREIVDPPDVRKHPVGGGTNDPPRLDAEDRR